MKPRIVLSLLALLSLSCVAPDAEPLAASSAALARSSQPPGGLAAAVVPQFVSVSFDDNFGAGMGWATDFFRGLQNPAGTGQAATFDGTAVRTTFFHNSLYLGNAGWPVAVADGHETANHTVNHQVGLSHDTARWTPEVVNGRSQLASGLDVPLASVAGFRTPYLGYNDDLYGVLAAQSPAVLYDTSIQSCWASGETAGSCPWPYTLDAGSADAATVLTKFGSDRARPVGAHPGLWEVPVTALVVPPDALAAAYGFTPGLRQRTAAALADKLAPSFYEVSSGKVAGLDITLIVDGKMNKAEALATLKYTFDLHLAGNRAPFVFVAHTHVYAEGYGAAPNVPSTADRRAIIEEFVRYTLAKPAVRLRPMADVVAWMKAPVGLGGGVCRPSCSGRTCGPDGCGGSCGSCGGGQTCTFAGVCQSTCRPSCSGRTCGPDGCGGSCGTCGGGQTCTFAGVCQSTCTPSCSGRTCGPDGCGGSCGSCGGGQTCTSAGVCQGGVGNCSAAGWTSGAYAAGAVVTASCDVATVGTACYGNVGGRFAWRCDNAGWCGALRPGSDQGGWWSAWSSLERCN